MLRFFCYKDFNGPRDLLQKLNEYTLLAHNSGDDPLHDLSSLDITYKTFQDKSFLRNGDRLVLSLRHIPTWIKEKAALKKAEEERKLEEKIKNEIPKLPVKQEEVKQVSFKMEIDKGN